MQKKTLGLGTALAGVIVLVVSAYADALGLGKSDGLGRDQIAGIVFGAVVILVGLAVAFGSAESE